jgi:hypothetical protein
VKRSSSKVQNTYKTIELHHQINERGLMFFFPVENQKLSVIMVGEHRQSKHPDKAPVCEAVGCLIPQNSHVDYHLTYQEERFWSSSSRLAKNTQRWNTVPLSSPTSSQMITFSVNGTSRAGIPQACSK